MSQSNDQYIEEVVERIASKLANQRIHDVANYRRILWTFIIVGITFVLLSSYLTWLAIYTVQESKKAVIENKRQDTTELGRHERTKVKNHQQDSAIKSNKNQK